jgi:D-glycero-D-manno-heptose 1,7-bisphosphate phosphatase
VSWGVFLDRDGTLVPDARHPVRPEQLHLYSGAGKGLRTLARAGAMLLVVSNQSAVARGLLDLRGLRHLDRRLKDLVAAEGARIRRAYYCPHHPAFTGPCSCRKPGAAMLRAGLRDFGLNPGRSFLVGDTVNDLRAGRTAGVVTVLVLTGHGRAARVEALRRGLADHVARDLTGAARWIAARRLEG